MAIIYQEIETGEKNDWNEYWARIKIEIGIVNQR